MEIQRHAQHTFMFSSQQISDGCLSMCKRKRQVLRCRAVADLGFETGGPTVEESAKKIGTEAAQRRFLQMKGRIFPAPAKIKLYAPLPPPPRYATDGYIGIRREGSPVLFQFYSAFYIHVLA